MPSIMGNMLEESMSQTMALFVPQWPSMADDDAADGNAISNADDHGNGINNDSSSNDNLAVIGTATMNGHSHKDEDGAPAADSMAVTEPSSSEERPNKEQSQQPSNDDGGIELMHDPLTGSVKVTESDDEDDEAGRQCQLWSAASPTTNDADGEDEGGGGEADGIEVNAASAFGDIWSTEAFGFNTASPLKELLDSNDFSLVDLLRQDELLQELRCCEARLVEYFGKEDVVAGLVECLTVEVPYSDGGGSYNVGAGKERWCAEEEERRRARRELKQNNAPSASPTGLERVPSTVMDASSPKQDEPHVEAKWNSPQKRRSPEKKSCQSNWVYNSPSHLSREEGEGDDEKRTPEEEYDLRFIRYPYMACEVLCSEVGTALDVLVDGHVDDVVINDEEDSLLGATDGGGGEVTGMKEVKMEENDDVEPRVGSVVSDVQNLKRLTTPVPMNLRSPPSPPPSLAPPSIQLKPKVLTAAAVASSPPPPRQRRRRILDLLFSALLQSPPASLDDRRAGYLEKLLNVLFRKRSQAMCDYMDTSFSLATNDEGAGSASATAGGTTALPPMPTCVDPGLTPGAAGASPPRMPLSSDVARFGAVGDATAPSSSYVSLSAHGSPSYEADDTNVAEESNSAPTIDADGDERPPMLMCALFDHLHSHSIMHVVQRLLLPSPMRQQQQGGQDAPQSETSKEDTNKDKENEDDNPNSAMNNQFMSALNQMNNGGSSPSTPDLDDDEDEDMEEDDPMNHIFQCTWSSRPRTALELLMKRLEGHTGSFLLEYNYPVGYDRDVEMQRRKDEMMMADGGKSKEEASLLCAQNASEILITIIQNSSLDSPIARTLTSDPALRRVLDLIVPLPLLEGEPPEFVAHESVMTCAISVLESLVLQLGGYGAEAADATSTPGGEASAKEGDSSMKEGEADGQAVTSLGEIGLHAHPSSSLTLPLADTSALLRHMPALLARLSELLTHVNTQMWVVPGTQYSTRTNDDDGVSSARPVPLLGTSRLRILRLVESLVLLGDPLVDEALLKSDVLQKALELFWQFEWCSMLHQTIANLLVHVFEGGRDRSGLQGYFLGSGNGIIGQQGNSGGGGCRLLERLMGSFGGEISPVGATSVAAAATAQGDASGFVGDEAGKEMPSSHSGSDEIDGEVGIDTAGTGPRYGEMMLAMKDLYQSQESPGTTSSMESEHGSVGENEDGCDDPGPLSDEIDDANVAPVSEDDVDSAMEKESQESGEMIGMTPEDVEEEDNLQTEKSSDLTVDDDPSALLQRQDQQQQEQGCNNDGPRPKTCFRKGYMGHVIIICQALVHACNSSASEETVDAGGGTMDAILEETGPQTLASTSLDEISATSSFETSAIVPHSPVEHDNDCETNSASAGNSKKRKDRSPIRDGSHHEDLKRLASSPIEGDSFPRPKAHVINNDLAPLLLDDVALAEADASNSAEDLQPPKPPPPSPSTSVSDPGPAIDDILRRHPLHDRWREFVASVLASEMSVQSTPLGGVGGQDVTSQQPTLQGQEIVSLGADDSDLPQKDAGASSTGPCVNIGGGVGAAIVAVGEIDMDENDLDIAASMMEALSLPPSPSTNGGSGDGPLKGHGRRCRGVIGGGSSLGSSVEKGSRSGGIGGNFGSVIQQLPAAGVGFKDYVYDDPLGGIHPFGSNGGSDDEEEENKNNAGTNDGFSKRNDLEDFDNDGFMSDAMVVSKEDGGVSAKQQQPCDTDGANNGSNMKKSGSNSSNSDATDDDDDDDDVPVLDMFVGSFEANFANFDAFESSCCTTSTAVLTNVPDSNVGNPFQDNSDGMGEWNPFEGDSGAIGSNDSGIAVDNSKAEEDDAALFEFSKTPFDLVDTLSTLDNDAGNENGAGVVSSSSSPTFFTEGNNGK